MSRILPFILCLLTPLLTWSQEGDWDLYVNENFDFTFEYPADFFAPVKGSEDANGQRFISKDGHGLISVYGGINLNHKSLQQEYDDELLRLKRNKTEVYYSEINTMPFQAVIGEYTIKGRQLDNFFIRRTIWYDSFYATIVYSCNIKSEPSLRKYETEIVKSLDVYGKSYKPQSELISNVWINDTIRIPDEVESPDIADFWLAYSEKYPYIITQTGRNLILHPDELLVDDVDTWSIDRQHGYIGCKIISNFDLWMEMFCWNRTNGHKLLAVSYNDPYQIIFFYDYNPATHELLPATDVMSSLNYSPDFVARLPHVGKSIFLYEQSNITKPVAYLRWNGNGFTYQNAAN